MTLVEMYITICDLLQEKGPFSINIHFLIIAKMWKNLFLEISAFQSIRK